MTFHYTLATKHADMYTFTQWNENHRAIAHIRGFGKTESEALANAKSELSTHVEHSAPAPHSARARNF
jgi:DNA-directed RNA polymerase subunit F